MATTWLGKSNAAHDSNALTLLVLLAFLLTLAHPAAAWTVLANQAGQAVVRDDATGNLWVRDLSTFASQTYGEQLSGIQRLNAEAYFGIAQWHLATPTEMDALWGQSTTAIRAMFLPSQTSYSGAFEWHYWSGRYEQGAAGLHSASETGWGTFAFGPWDYPWPQQINLSDTGIYAEHGAWVGAVVPEPHPSGLLITTLVLLCALNRGEKLHWRRR